MAKLCKVEIKKGPRKGEPCGKYIVEDNLCQYHLSQKKWEEKNMRQSQYEEEYRNRIVEKAQAEEIKTLVDEHISYSGAPSFATLAVNEVAALLEGYIDTNVEVRISIDLRIKEK